MIHIVIGIMYRGEKCFIHVDRMLSGTDYGREQWIAQCYADSYGGWVERIEQ